MSRFDAFVRLAAFAACFALVAGPASAAKKWEPVAGDLGRDASRFALHIGGSYGAMEGSELENLDASKGFDVGVSFRVLGSISLAGYYAVDRADVNGQVVQLLDQPMRPSGRSGTVAGQVETSRFRAGVRVDAYRESGWKFQPYVLGAVVFSSIDVTIDSVNGISPPPPVPTGNPGAPLVDISRITDDQIGGLARIGVEYSLTSILSLDVNGNFEVIETEPGTNSIFAVNSGLAFRF